MSYLSETISIWNLGTLYGLLCSHEFGPQGHAGRGARVQNLGHLESVLFTLCFLFSKFIY